MSRHRLVRPVLAVLLAAAALAPARSGALSRDEAERYTAAVRLARAGRVAAAIGEFSALAEENPSSASVHGALAQLALSAGEADAWTERFRIRRRANRRDIGAAVGLGVFERARGRKSESHRLLREAVVAGSSDAMLAALLVDTAPDEHDLVGWLAARAGVTPADAGFAALRVRVLLALGRCAAAQRVLRDALAKHSGHLELLTLSAQVQRAAGDTDRACADARAVVARLGAEELAPESRAPARLLLARVFIACGKTDDAQRLLRTLGPLVVLPGERSLIEPAALVEAELALARKDPLDALNLLADKGAPPDDDPDWGEAARAVRMGARALLNLRDGQDEAILAAPPPKGLGAADRSAALAALALTGRAHPPEFAPTLRSVAQVLATQELQPRAARLFVLADAAAGTAAPADAVNALDPSALGAASADVLVASRLVAARRALAAGDPGSALLAASLDTRTISSAPGRLLAALQEVVCRAALAADQPARAVKAAQAGLLDIEVARGVESDVAPELAPLVDPASEIAVELAGLSFRALVAAGRTSAEAADGLLQNLARAARGWTQTEKPWPADLPELTQYIRGDACLVVAATGAGAPALAINSDGEVGVATPDLAALSAPCVDRRRVLWAGPAAPAGGLATAPGEPRLLVRLLIPGPQVREPTPPAPKSLSVTALGAGPDRSLRRLVESLARPAPRPGEQLAQRFAAGREWPLFHGAGIAPRGAPFAAGWLVPPARLTPAGWIGPESLTNIPPTAGVGLVALGLSFGPGVDPLESGPRALAEAAVNAGWPWVLLSRRPLSAEERGRVHSRLAAWAEDPLKEALRLARRDPALADVLTLWTPPAQEIPRDVIGESLLFSLVAAVVVLLVVLALHWRRRRPRTPRAATPINS